jgi:hypothetical protein
MESKNYKKILKSVLVCGAAIMSMSTVNTLAEETEPLQNFTQQMDSMDHTEASNFLRSYGLRNGTVAGSKVSVSRTSSGFTVQNPKWSQIRIKKFLRLRSGLGSEIFCYI